MSELDPTLIKEARGAASGEVPFAVSELFFSRTNERGIIEAGNAVFQRISGFEWSELLGAPHKVVRHPDMPKGLFWLMWDRLGSGVPVGVYVKNRTKDGRHYWVFAVAAPVEGGFVSIRLKPTSDKLAKIIQHYDEMRQEEQAGMSPEDSAALFLKRLKARGYVNYESFQAASLAAETEARLQRLGRPLENVQSRFVASARAITQIQSEAEEMIEAFKAIRTVPMNMRIIASRLENAGGPISAISSNYGSMLDEMDSWVHEFIDGDDSVFSRIRDAIVNGQFLSFVQELQHEMYLDARQENVSGDQAVDMVAEAARLQTLSQDCSARMSDALRVVASEATRLGRSVQDMKRYVTGLSSTRMMCKIESATLSGSGNQLVGIVEQLDECQDQIEGRLARIMTLNSVIQSNTAMMNSTV